jgi:hypothetical protein
MGTEVGEKIVRTGLEEMEMKAGGGSGSRQVKVTS